jgi:hypothetical protein
MMGIDIAGVGALANAASKVVGAIWPDKTEIEKAQMANALALIQGQMETNKIEAANPSMFVSGWRPFIGWVCGCACAWNWMGLPITVAALKLVGQSLDLHPASLTEMMPILIGMLGLGGYRTYEKTQGVAAVGLPRRERDGK